MLCVIETLSNDYLHVDLSHISPYSYVNGDPTTIYNLLEIMDGLLEFMMEQISNSAGKINVTIELICSLLLAFNFTLFNVSSNYLKKQSYKYPLFSLLFDR